MSVAELGLQRGPKRLDLRVEALMAVGARSRRGRDRFGVARSGRMRSQVSRARSRHEAADDLGRGRALRGWAGDVGLGRGELLHADNDDSVQRAAEECRPRPSAPVAPGPWTRAAVSPPTRGSSPVRSALQDGVLDSIVTKEPLGQLARGSTTFKNLILTLSATIRMGVTRITAQWGK